MSEQSKRANNGKTESPFLNTRQAGDYVKLSPRTLEKKRVTGDGPRFRKHGRYVFYHIDALDAWSREREQASTSGV